MLKQTDEERAEPSTVSQDAVERLRDLTDAEVRADLNADGGRNRVVDSTAQKTARHVAPFKVACSIIIVSTLGAVVSWPVTSGMAKSQLKMVAGINALAIFQGTGAERAREITFVAEHPDDASIQFGGALRGTQLAPVGGGVLNGPERADQLRSVANKFPNHPEILASMLRAESQAEVLVHRPDAMQFLDNKPAKTTGNVVIKPPKLSDAAAVKRFIDQCREGERVDQDNMYFPFLRAMAHTELRQDKDAFAALHLAASKKVWREYIPEEFLANRTVNRGMYGQAGLISEMAISAAILFPHYASLRELSRVVLAEAVRLEISGDIQGGLALRQDMVTVATGMRNQATTLIGSLVGNAMIEISLMRPGGVMPIKAPKSDQKLNLAAVNEARAKNRARFAEYARRNGFPALSARVPEIVSMGERIRTVALKGMDRSIYGMQSVTRLAIGQGITVILLANMVWMLIIGAIATAVVRTPRFVAGNRLPPGPFVAAVAGIGLAMVASGGLTGMSVGYTVRAITGLTMTGEAESMVPTAAIVAGMVIAFPMLLTIILAIWAALNKRASFTRTITGGFAAVSLPAATVMVLAWGAIMTSCAGLDTQGTGELFEMLQHEGKYLFRIMGEKWPI